MKRTLKVYGWQGDRREQTREVVAAYSKAEVRRILGLSAYDNANLFNFAETGNAEEIATALSAPGTVFWKPLNSPDGYRFSGGFTASKT
jgi:hypothetical protein